MSSLLELEESKCTLFAEGEISTLQKEYRTALKSGWNPFDPRLFSGAERLNETQLLALVRVGWNPNQAMSSGKPLWFEELETRREGEHFKLPWRFKALGASFSTRHQGEHWTLPHARGLLALNLPQEKLNAVWFEEWLWMEHEGSTPSLVAVRDWEALFNFLLEQGVLFGVKDTLTRFALDAAKTALRGFE